jgi:branched-chain amino acid transport system ATP-binding protein
MRRDALLDVRNLSAFYGRAQVLFGLSIHLYPGEVVALVGRNGAGKTTTLKAIMGLISASATHATFKGHSLGKLPTYKVARLGLGYVPEDRRIFTDLTVEMRGRRGNQMSGGEQQMLSIARTLMGNPDAILLDEPSEGIAPVIVQMMAEAIRAMKAEGVAVLLSEQNWAFAAGISDRACVIERGEIRFQGSMAELMADEALRAETLGV